MYDKIEEKTVILPPFKHFIMTVGEIPTSYLETMTYYEMLVWFTNYLGKTVIPAINENGEAVTELQNLFVELQNYVNDYFENLDVQEEINNKLDDMVEAGTLQEIIADYLNSKAVFGYDTVQDMKEATNLINGSYAKTLGYYEKNDGGSSLYKIREITNADVVDGSFIIALENENLIAELINIDEINLSKIGLKGDGITDDTTKFNLAITYAKNNNVKITSYEDKTYLVNQTLDLSNLYVDFNMSTIKTNSEINIITINSETYYGEIKNVILDCNTIATAGIHVEMGRKLNIKNVNVINIKQYGIYYKNGYELIVDTIHLHGTEGNNTVGLYCTSGDSNFSNIVMIDCKTGIENINGSNYYTNVHAWIHKASLLVGSIFYKCNAGSCFLTNCYSDTYQYSIYQYSYVPRLQIVNFFNVYNTGIYTSEIATEHAPEFMHCESLGGEAQTRISNSTIIGYSSSIKTKLTNLTSFNGDIVNSYFKNVDHTIPFNSVDTSSATSGVTLTSSSLEKTNKNVYLKHIVSVNATDTKTFTLGNIPWYFRPGKEYIGTASYGTGVYNAPTGVCYLYIALNGNITVTLPSTATGTTVIKINTNFLTYVDE